MGEFEIQENPFVVVVLEARIDRGAPLVYLAQMANLVRKVLARLCLRPTRHVEYVVLVGDDGDGPRSLLPLGRGAALMVARRREWP